MKLATKNNDKFAISNINCTLAALLIAQGKYSEVPTLLDNAEQIAKSRNDNYILDLVNVNYGSYYQFYKKDNIKAIQHYVQAREYAIKLGSEYEEMRAVSNLSETYLLNNQLNEAIVNAERAIALAEKMGYTDARQRMLEVLSKAEAGKHDYEKAYKHLLFSSQLKDSVFNETNSEKINSLEIKYQTEKKENEINNLSAQKRQRTTLNYFLATAILSLIVLMYLFYRGKQKSKIIAQQALLVKEKQIAEMEKERQLIAAKSVLEGEETERIRLANDLHDGLGGLLSGVKLNLSSMKENNILSVENTAAFNRTVGLLDNSIKELRRIAHNLMPENLMRFGLKYAISEFVSSLNDTKISFSFYGEETRYEKELELTVYRITQELVNNALKYSEATQIGVQLILENERINVPVMDNGVGFDKSIIDGISKGTGLQQIKNRVNAMNGKFEINSTPNEGTEAYIEFSSI